MKIQNLESFLDIEGGGGIAIPYIGYAEVNLKFPEIQNFDEDVLMMVMNDSRYGDMVPFAIGTIHTHAALNVITDEEWKNLSLSWRCAALPAYGSEVAEMDNFSLDSVKGNVKAHKGTILPPFNTIFVKGKSTVKGHHKRVNVATVSVRNLTSKEITLKAGTVIGQIEAANAVPPMLTPKSEDKLKSNKDAKSGME